MKKNKFIAHHGIQGQKWGVRRYQNEDGTLTDAGKRRYSSDDVINFAKTNNNYFTRSEREKQKWESLNSKIFNDPETHAMLEDAKSKFDKYKELRRNNRPVPIEKTEAYKENYQKYRSRILKDGDDHDEDEIAYGFSHYEFTEDHPDYKKAVEQSQSKALNDAEKEYSIAVKKVGKYVCEGVGKDAVVKLKDSPYDQKVRDIIDDVITSKIVFSNV